MLKYTLVNMLERSTLTSGVIACLLVVTVCYCAIVEIPVPDSLNYALTGVIGWFFGAKATDAARSTIRRVEDDNEKFR